ncbi:MAG: RidA family protein [Sandaracinaceae bacterium]|nr:RidA family protein [Sandaracinaceae bacterium]
MRYGRRVATIVNPDTLAPPRGYSNGILLGGERVLFVAGQIGWDASMKVADGLTAQFALALDNVLDVVRAAGGQPEHVGRMTIYVVDRHEYVREAKAIGAAYRARFGGHYPAMSLVQVAALLEEGARVEIEVTAVLPAEAS